MFVAEIASNFCEEYVFDSISKDLSDKDRLILNMEKIGSLFPVYNDRLPLIFLKKISILFSVKKDIFQEIPLVKFLLNM